MMNDIFVLDTNQELFHLTPVALSNLSMGKDIKEKSQIYSRTLFWSFAEGLFLNGQSQGYVLGTACTIISQTKNESYLSVGLARQVLRDALTMYRSKGMID